MLQQFGLMAQFVVLVVGVAVGSHLPHSALAVSIALLIGAVVLVPLARRPLSALERLLSPVPHGPPGTSSYGLDSRDVAMPGAPGTPGTALARAPARGVRAFA